METLIHWLIQIWLCFISGVTGAVVCTLWKDRNQQVTTQKRLT